MNLSCLAASPALVSLAVGQLRCDEEFFWTSDGEQVGLGPDRARPAHLWLLEVPVESSRVRGRARCSGVLPRGPRWLTWCRARPAPPGSFCAALGRPDRDRTDRPTARVASRLHGSDWLLLRLLLARRPSWRWQNQRSRCRAELGAAPATGSATSACHRLYPPPYVPAVNQENLVAALQFSFFHYYTSTRTCPVTPGPGALLLSARPRRSLGGGRPIHRGTRGEVMERAPK